MASQAIAERELTLADFDFDLPAELIAQHPLPDRAASRLLHVEHGRLSDCRFRDIVALLDRDDLLVFNDTRVIKARLYGHKPSGGKVELLIERVLEPTVALALVRTSHRPGEGSRFVFAGGAEATVEGRREDFFVLRFNGDVSTILDQQGHVPLPPYIAHADSEADLARYQTVYAARPGAVAAPTAGLHFSQELLAQVSAKGVQQSQVTLHVGAGTFQPVRSERLSDHRMHREWFEIPAATADAVNEARRSGRRVVAVGTTTLRALESAVLADGKVSPGPAETMLFITPGFAFRVVDRLITNFHLPRSTLLMLVSAFAGVEPIRHAYAHAIRERYRFFSYGDAMLLERSS